MKASQHTSRLTQVGSSIRPALPLLMYSSRCLWCCRIHVLRGKLHRCCLCWLDGRPLGPQADHPVRGVLGAYRWTHSGQLRPYWHVHRGSHRRWILSRHPQYALRLHPCLATAHVIRPRHGHPHLQFRDITTTMGNNPPYITVGCPLIAYQRGLISGLHAQSVSCGFAAANVRFNRVAGRVASSFRFYSGSDTDSHTRLVNFSGGSLSLSVCDDQFGYISSTNRDRMPPGHRSTPRNPVSSLLASLASRERKRA